MRRKIYMEKPKFVEAIQFTGGNGIEVSELIYGEDNEVQWRISYDMMVVAGDLIIQKGMWVVKARNGGVMLMQDSVFRMNYKEGAR